MSVWWRRGESNPVRKHFLGNLSGRRRLFLFRACRNRHAAWVGSFMGHAGGQSLPRSRAPLRSCPSPARGPSGEDSRLIKQRQELRCRCSLIYKLPVLRMADTSARYSRTHVPVETSTPPDRKRRRPAGGLGPRARGSWCAVRKVVITASPARDSPRRRSPRSWT